MRVSDFEFELPEHLIAKYPSEVRSASRLLHLDVASGDIYHYHFYDLPQLLCSPDLLVFNNTKVIPARMYGQKDTGGQVEIFLERLIDAKRALVQIRSSKSPKAGSEITLRDGNGLSDVTLKIITKDQSFYSVMFPELGVMEIAERFGHVPLPPYIDRDDEDDDQDRYQTIYASKAGAVAAPTAGLHFDNALMQVLSERGIGRAELTLHVGAGTFQPVRVDNVEDHKMHLEYLEVGRDVCDAVSACRSSGGRAVAVGTTSVRSLETASGSLNEGKGLSPYKGETDIFIYPGYEFQSVDALITNFHLPGSTLMMLVSAFAGREIIKEAYRVAIAESYRFFSYGDSMIITR